MRDFNVVVEDNYIQVDSKIFDDKGWDSILVMFGVGWERKSVCGNVMYTWYDKNDKIVADYHIETRLRVRKNYIPIFNKEVTRVTQAYVLCKFDTDLYETDGFFTLVVDLPGVREEGFVVHYMDGKITIKGDFFSPYKEDVLPKEYLLNMRKDNVKFEESYIIPSLDIIEENINCTFRRGVLTVRIPKVPQKKPKKIDVVVED